MERVGQPALRDAGDRDQRRAGHDQPGRDQPDDPHPAGLSYFDDWEGNEQPFVTKDPLGNDVDPRHPWNKVTLPKPQKRDFAEKYSWVVSPRV